ncbi:ATP-binding protein [Streptomyces sp. NPDC050507]|uniref:ATP-binding protein n=1 Tax=Streptomyces sp. NPDC050507 TaxID=3365619 RepID=UPI0037A2118F
MTEIALDVPFEIKSPRSLASVPRARKALQKALTAWGVPTDSAADVLLVADELGSNAVTHSHVRGRQWHLVAIRHSGAVRVEVSDSDGDTRPQLTHVAPADQPETEGGRGLELVAALSEGRWGVVERVVGKTVWAEVKVAEEAGQRGAY